MMAPAPTTVVTAAESPEAEIVALDRRQRVEIPSSINAILCSITGSRSPSLAVRRIVSAMAWTCEELTGSGSDATALSNATFMIAIVSGGNDAFEKSFMLESIRSRPWASSPRHTNELLPLRMGWLPPPTTAPSASPSTATAEKPHHEEQQYRADGGVDDRADDTAAEMDAELGQQPTAYKGAEDTDDQIADDPESGPAYDLTGQPACNEPYEQYDQEAFARHIHLATSIVGPNGVHQRNQVLR
jgi:hypothetical protein